MKSGRILFCAALVALIALCAGASYRLSNNKPDQPVTYNHKSIPQERSTHAIVFLEESGEPVGLCTATAIGPHALMTAQHCNEGKVPLTTVLVDASVRRYRLLARRVDNRDHVIYLLDGPAFKNVDPYITRPPVMGENIFIVGCGKNDFPCDIKRGKVIDEYDPSEVDQQDEIFYFSVPVVHGDSGSIVYGEDGAVLGIVTYLVVKGQEGSGFQTAFSKEDIDVARTFDLLDIILGGLSNGNNSGNTPAAPTGLGAEAH